ncbi:MAG: hypothetical protein AABO57_05750 [Acidobacteriota bacterium]
MIDNIRSLVKSTLKRTFLYDLLRKFRMWNEARRPPESEASDTWGLGPSSTEEVKQSTVREYGERFNVAAFIETGTYEGEMVDAVKTSFSRIYSVELDSALFERAESRFTLYEHITILRGDSGDILPQLLRDLRVPSLFWLDAHYSHGITARGELETPIMRELESILHHDVSGHVILIDDVRCFTGEHDYPTVEEVQQFVFSTRPELKFSVADDIIRIHP